MRLLDRLLAQFPRSGPDPREELRPLWNAVVAEARRPAWYRDGGVNDSVTGRFDMVCAVLAAVLLKLEGAGRVRETALLTEHFVHDMDGQLREFGVGDMIVGKRIGELVSAMGGRLDAYRKGLSADEAVLAEAVARNVSLRDGTSPAVVARSLRALADRLARTADEGLLAGEIAQ
jgi:cytochrome b pre-mRNA-processing protein 3